MGGGLSFFKIPIGLAMKKFLPKFSVNLFFGLKGAYFVSPSFTTPKLNNFLASLFKKLSTYFKIRISGLDLMIFVCFNL